VRLTHAAIIALVAALSTVSALLWAANKQHAAAVAKMSAELNAAQSNEKNCAEAINAQNLAIEKIRVDTLYLDREVSRVVTKYSVMRDTITKILERDNSCEKQIDVIGDMLRSFSDGRVRPESRSQD